MQFILIEPDVKRVSWGVVKFCDLMQDVEVSNDKEDSRSLLITIHKPVNNIYVRRSHALHDGQAESNPRSTTVRRRSRDSLSLSLDIYCA
jgi:hypothetical protein